MAFFLTTLILLQYVGCLLVANVGMLIFGRILYFVFVNHQEQRLTAHLVLHVVGWVLFMLSSLPLAMYTLSFWKGVDTLYHSNWLFWTGVFNMCTGAVVSVLTFFLLLNRTLSVYFADRYNKYWKWTSFGGGLVTAAACWTLVFLLTNDDGPFPKMTHCMSFGCMLSNTGARAQFLVRIVFGFFNLGTLMAFLLIIVRSEQKQGQTYAGKDIINLLTRNVVVVDLCTSFALSLITFSIDQWTTVELSDYLGAFVLTISSVDGILTAMVYSKTLSWNGSIRESIKAVVVNTRDELF